MNALIHFRCRAVDHQAADLASASRSPITLHDHLWAYCPLGVIEGHEWERLEGGRSLDELKRRTFSEARLA